MQAYSCGPPSSVDGSTRGGSAGRAMVPHSRPCLLKEINMRALLLASIIALPASSALADRKAGDTCAAGLSAPSRDLYAKTLASNPTPATARSIVVAETEKLISAGKLPMIEARSAAKPQANASSSSPDDGRTGRADPSSRRLLLASLGVVGVRPRRARLDGAGWRRRIAPSCRSPCRRSPASPTGRSPGPARPGGPSRGRRRGRPTSSLVLVDDAGFGNPSTFGGPVATPTLDKLASEGLRYNGFHVTALCSPTRAALLTGRNQHAVGFGSIAELGGGWPGYDSHLPRSAATIARVLQGNGYSTAAFGKWHLTPPGRVRPGRAIRALAERAGLRLFLGLPRRRDRPVPADPLRERQGAGNAGREGIPVQHAPWPTGPSPGSRTRSRPRPTSRSSSTTRPARAMRRTRSRRNGAPSTRAASIPVGTRCAPRRSSARSGSASSRQDTALTPRDPAFPAWDTLAPEVRQLASRQMEVFAGYQEETDHEIGRVVDAIEALGRRDNTLVVYIFGDNGASMEGTETGTFNEMVVLNGIPLTQDQQLQAIKAYGGLSVWGGPRVEPHYAAAWALGRQHAISMGQAGRLPSRRHAQSPGRALAEGHRRQGWAAQPVSSRHRHRADAFRSGRRSGPQERGRIPRRCRCTASPSCRASPTRLRPQSTALSISRSWATAPCTRTDGGSPAGMPRIPWKIDMETLARFAPGRWDPDADPCELYDLNSDFSQAHDLAAANPAKVAELRALFWDEAARFQVLPLLGSIAIAYGGEYQKPEAKTLRFTYRPGVENLSPGVIPQVYNRSFAIEAELRVARNECLLLVCSGAEGVIVAEGDFLGGFSLYVMHGKPRFTYSFLGLKIDTVEGGGTAAGRARHAALRVYGGQAGGEGDGRRREAPRQRPRGRLGADRAHRSRPVHVLCRPRHRTRQWPSRRARASLCVRAAIRHADRDRHG